MFDLTPKPDKTETSKNPLVTKEKELKLEVNAQVKPERVSKSSSQISNTLSKKKKHF